MPLRETVLVTDGDLRATLAITRSLGRAGYRVHVTASDSPSLAGSSRYCHEGHEVPDPSSDPGDYRQAVERIVAQADAAVLIPVSEASLLRLLSDLAASRDVVVPFPPRPVFRRATDKHVVLSLGERLDIDVPETTVLEGLQDFDPQEVADLGFPVVLKPNRSLTSNDERLHESSVSYARDLPECRQRLEALPPHGFPVLLQHRVGGEGVGVFFLRWNTGIMARFAHRRIREKPPSGGVSVLRESIEVPEALFRQSRLLLEELDWWGPAMVEYRWDRRNDRYYLMEVNPRFWGSLQLAIDAGVDFPHLLVELALSRPIEPTLNYRTGVRTRWCWGEVDHLISRFRKDDPPLPGLPPGDDSPASEDDPRIFIARETAHPEVLRCKDPMPFLHETRKWLKDAGARFFGRTRDHG